MSLMSFKQEGWFVREEIDIDLSISNDDLMKLKKFEKIVIDNSGSLLLIYIVPGTDLNAIDKYSLIIRRLSGKLGRIVKKNKGRIKNE
jgi:hypothetical protein